MRQIIDKLGKCVDGTDWYVIDGSIKGRKLTRESMKYIKRTLAVGGSDIHAELDLCYRIVHVSRCNYEGVDSWTLHIPCDAMGRII